MGSIAKYKLNWCSRRAYLPLGHFGDSAIMRRFSSRILAGCLATLAIVPLSAQSKDPQPDEHTTFRSDTRLVVLHATVIDKSGKFITNLPQTAFHVFENNVEQPIKKVLREDVPVSMGLIVDNSGSMRTKRARVEASALALVKASNPQDEVFIVNFNDEAFLDQPFTSNIKELEKGLAKSIRAAARRCAMRSACRSII